ncbi:MAG TPA: hypothetical protein VGB82_19030 [Alphaproteobacteria bacterium]
MGFRFYGGCAAVILTIAASTTLAQAPVTSDNPPAKTLPPLPGPPIDVPVFGAQPPAPATPVQPPARVEAPPPAPSLAPPAVATGAPTPLAPPPGRAPIDTPPPPEQAQGPSDTAQPPMIVQRPRTPAPATAAQVPLPPQPAADIGGSFQPPMVVQRPAPTPAPVIPDWQAGRPELAQQPATPACKDGTYAAIIDGRPQIVRTRLCQQPDGSWKVTP